MGTILYGSEIAKDIRTSLKEQIDELREKGKRIPKLVVILVGDNPASLSYVTGKEKACREIGMENILLRLQEDTYLPCTPKGILRMLDTAGYSDLSGLRAVVIGRSNIVGKPVAQLLLNRNATVTICHSRTRNIEEICAEADILIASVGSPRLVTADWVKKGAVVIDVGINRVDGRLCGDVDFETVKDKAAVITPVPKGVGPMTIAMLLENTLESYRKHS